MMTLLDDYQAYHKLQGVQIVLDLLERVSKDVLKRTGLDGLLLTVSIVYSYDYILQFNSMGSCLSL
jgi:hypothetical protein